MTIWNKIYNWIFRIKHCYWRGCRNVAIVKQINGRTYFRKYDWSKLFTFVSKECWMGKESLL